MIGREKEKKLQQRNQKAKQSNKFKLNWPGLDDKKYEAGYKNLDIIYALAIEKAISKYAKSEIIDMISQEGYKNPKVISFGH